MDQGLINLRWARAIVDGLASAGIRHVCISPGSRSTPLVLAVAERADLSTSVHVDERSAGFFALGYGRATGSPAALVCTSGTAAANYLPAVIEAHYSRVPLVVLTADRPPELRDTGAWQAIDQVKLYGAYVRWFAEVATPSDDPGMLRYARHVAVRAVAVARGAPRGPVHLDLPFREPLVPLAPARAGAEVDTRADVDHPATVAPAASAGVEAGSVAGGVVDVGADVAGEACAVVTVPPTTAVVGDDVLDDLARQIAAVPRGMILAGQLDPPPGYADAVARLAAATGYPVLAEPTGGLRFGPHDRSHVVAGYDAFLRSDRWCDAHAADLVLRFGASFACKHVAGYLERNPGTVQVVVDPQATWDDPTRRASLRLTADPVPLCAGLVDRVSRLAPVGTSPAGADRAVTEGERAAWRDAWLHASGVAGGVLARMTSDPEPGAVAGHYAALLAALPDGAILYAANSMAVRDLDTFSRPIAARLRAIANRGAAGIDGTVSSALGAASGSGAPTVLVTGDLAFAHDLGGLAAARMPGVDLTIVVLNDGGGGIFEYLPVAGLDAAVFERFFTTPSGLDIGAACAASGIAHTLARTPGELAGPLRRDGPGRAGTRVIEVPIDRPANTAAHRAYWSAVCDLVGGA